MQAGNNRNAKVNKTAGGQAKGHDTGRGIRVSIAYSHNGRTLADSVKAYLARIARGGAHK